ncbi:MAG: type II toxin-antitoxin system HicA family toxin [bacterium]
MDSQKGPSLKNWRFPERRDLERKLRQAGCYLKCEGASHFLWVQPATGTVETVPRHQEIKELLAKKILKNLRA